MTLPTVIRARPVERPWGGPGVQSLGLDAAGSAPVGEWWVPTDAFGPLVKIIDAHENLSIQLHPDDEVAKDLGYPCGKTEAWYILAARENAKIWIGLKGDRDPADFIDAAERGDDISSWLKRVPARPGDVVFVPPGTIHAIGAGITLLEVQQDSDVTLRVFDWNREPRRELHLASCRRAIRRDARAGIVPASPTGAQPGDHGWRLRIRDEHFQLFDQAFTNETTLSAANEGEAELLFVAQGHGELVLRDSRLPVKPGLFLLRPPGSAAIRVQPSPGADLLLLRTLR